MRPLHRRALDDTRTVLTAARPADLARPTPCAGWDLRALLGHVFGQNHGFAAAVEAATAGTSDVPRSAFADRPPDPDGVFTAWDASADRLAAAFAAAPLDRTVLLTDLGPDARLPVATVVAMHLLDTVVHAWDLATALGSSYRPDGELVAATLAVAQLIPVGASREDPGFAFAAVVPGEHADPWERALALTGRHPPRVGV